MQLTAPSSIGYGISLARVSDSIQTSLTEQHTGNLTRAAVMGVTIPEDARYSDTASRADSSQWINFQKALERIQDPDCRFVFAWQDSRIFGDEDQFLLIRRLLARAQVRLIYQDGREQDLISREGIVTGFLAGWQNQNELIRIRQRVADTHNIKAATGRLISRPPYGIDVVPLVEAPCAGVCKGNYRECDSWHGELSKKNTVWVVNEDELTNLVIMYKHMARGGTWGELERKLAQAGIFGKVRTITRSRTNVGKVVGGIPWTKHNMKRMLVNPFYMGLFTWGKTKIVRDLDLKEVVEKPHDEWIMSEHSLGPLISPELWEVANENIRRRSKTREELRVYPTLLWDQFIICGRCGWGMHPRKRANGTKNFGKFGGSEYDYACHGVYNPYCKCTVNHAVAERTLDYYLGSELSAHPRMPNLQVTFQTESAVDVEPQLKAIGIRLIELEEERERILQMEMKGRIKDDRADQEYARIANDKQAARERRDVLLASPEPETESGDVPNELKDLWPLLRDETLPIEERRLSLRRLIDRVVVDRPRIRVVLRKEPAAQHLEP